MLSLSFRLRLGFCLLLCGGLCFILDARLGFGLLLPALLLLTSLSRRLRLCRLLLILPLALFIRQRQRYRRLSLLFCGGLLSGDRCRVQYCIDWHIQKPVAQAPHGRRKIALRDW